MSDEPKSTRVRARDVAPYAWGLWSSVEGGKPFLNEVMGVHWSEDGTEIILGLDSHNFYFAKPDEEIDLVPIPPKTHRADYPPFVLGPPPIKKTCPTCGHTTTEKAETDIFGVPRATRQPGDETP